MQNGFACFANFLDLVFSPQVQRFDKQAVSSSDSERIFGPSVTCVEHLSNQFFQACRRGVVGCIGRGGVESTPSFACPTLATRVMFVLGHVAHVMKGMRHRLVALRMILPKSTSSRRGRIFLSDNAKFLTRQTRVILGAHFFEQRKYVRDRLSKARTGLH